MPIAYRKILGLDRENDLFPKTDKPVRILFVLTSRTILGVQNEIERYTQHVRHLDHRFTEPSFLEGRAFAMGYVDLSHYEINISLRIRDFKEFRPVEKPPRKARTVISAKRKAWLTRQRNVERRAAIAVAKATVATASTSAMSTTDHT